MSEKINGWVVDIAMEPPSLDDNSADAARLEKALAEKLKTGSITMDLELLKHLPERLRRWNYTCRCVVFQVRDNWQLIDVVDPEGGTCPAGIAVDLGTTRVVMRLVGLDSGETLSESAFDNPQTAAGPDILARIHHAQKTEGLQELQAMIIKGINKAVGDLCGEAGISLEHVYLMAVAGNTAMAHFFMRVPPQWLIREPYIPAVNRPGAFEAEEIGVVLHTSARVFVFPNAGSYFGGDLISGAYYAGFHENEEISVLVDVGTNAEVLLGNREWLVACAGAAGPALEGGVSEIGMTAGPGVIDSVSIKTETREFEIHTIDNSPPKGICGSGMIDLAAQLFLTGMLDIRGRLVPEACGNRLKEADGLRHLIVVFGRDSATGCDLTISQADLDSLIRSKAAMYTILETITGYVGISFKDISAFYVAGTFGSYIRPRSAISIGMLPDLAEKIFLPLGNSSLKGAVRLLQSRSAVADIESIRERITYLELNVNQDFMNRFSAAKFLPHTDAGRFPTVARDI
ncbi:MAG: ASKHA domain-containing protein [Desulfobacteraceae bacterium]|nr:ASKHA domain-containing protein [Desulfobacteraceae bacterium]